VRDKNKASAALHPGFRDDLLNKAGDFLELDARACLDLRGMKSRRALSGGNRGACLLCCHKSLARSANLLERLGQGERRRGHYRHRRHRPLHQVRGALDVQPFK